MATTTPVPVDDNLLAQRRLAVSNSQTITGLDYVNFNATTSKLELYFIAKNTGMTVPKMNNTNIQIAVKSPGNSDSSHLVIGEFTTDAISAPTLSYPVPLDPTSSINDADNTIYTLSLIEVSGDNNLSPLNGVDIFLFQADFAIQSNSQAQFDPLPPTATIPDDLPAAPEIDYLSRDYLTFRQLMLGRLSKLIPDWQANNEADLGSVIIEIWAYAADYLSYYQDAVATEAYLGTARSRISVKRHARLLDYSVSEGCNARTWVKITLAESATQPITLLQKTSLFSLSSFKPGAIVNGSNEQQQLLADSNVIQFATMYDVTLYPTHNEIHFYTWGSDQFSLGAGATSVTLLGNFSEMRKGDVLVFLQTKDSTNGNTINDPTLRCVVRLETITVSQDFLFLDSSGNPTIVTEITWSAQDALPFALIISNGDIADISLAYGNIVLADQGHFINDTPDNSQPELIPNHAPTQGTYRPKLRHTNLTFYQPFDNDAAIRNGDGASQATLQNLQATIPAITLYNFTQNNDVWDAQQDLLNSNFLSTDFVVETENNGLAFIRFGDGEFGQLPNHGDQFTASYRISNGSAGNIGADSLAYIVVESKLSGLIQQVSNPLPAQGGTDPEPIEQVKLYAPKAFAQLERCVTVQDYIQVTQQYSYRTTATGQNSNINSVNAVLRWTGSWNTIFIAIALKGGGNFDDNFKQGLLKYLSEFDLMHHDIEIINPQLVPLTINLPISVLPGYSFNVVKYSLIQRFSSATPAGFFYPDYFSFGQPVYLSNIIGTAMEVAGVALVDIKSATFQRFGEDGLAAQKVNIGPLEIAQVNSHVPNQGSITFSQYIPTNGE